MNRTNIINKLVKKYDYKRYLEIGVKPGTNFRQVSCEHKIGVDPDQKACATNKVTSDDFFEGNDEFFDIIFRLNIFIPFITL